MKVLYIGSGSGGNPLLSQASENLREENYDIKVIGYCSEDLDIHEETFFQVLNLVPSVDFIIINLHGSVPYFRNFTRLFDVIKSGTVPVFIMSTIDEEMAEYRSWFQYSDEDYLRVHSYLHLGGDQNMRFLLIWVYVRIGGEFFAYQNRYGHPLMVSITQVGIWE